MKHLTEKKGQISYGSIFVVVVIMGVVVYWINSHSYGPESGKVITDSSVNSNKPNISPEPQATVDNLQNTPKEIEYEGDARDELGSTAHYKLIIKPNLQYASIGGGPFWAIRGLGGNIYQFTEGPVLGMTLKLLPTESVLYNSDESYFCTLHRVVQSNQPTYDNTTGSTSDKNNNSLGGNTNVLKYDTAAKNIGTPNPTSVPTNQEERYDINGTWIGRQEGYNFRNQSGEEAKVNGNTIKVPASEWEFIFRKDGSISAKQENLQDHTIAYYKGDGGNDVNVSRGVALVHCNLSSADNTSNINLTLRLTNSTTATCMSVNNINGPDFTLTRK